MSTDPRSLGPPVAATGDIHRIFREIADLRAQVTRLERQHEIQVTRCGQLQADIDSIRRAWKATSES